MFPGSNPPDSKFEKISWDEWTSSFWVETISMYDVSLFVRAFQLRGIDAKPNRIPFQRKNEMAGFVRGDDGFTYILRHDRLLGSTYHEPVYTLKNP